MAKKIEEVKTEEAEDVFTKDSLLKSKRYAHRRDALSFLLKDGDLYTFKQVEAILKDFYAKG